MFFALFLVLAIGGGAATYYNKYYVADAPVTYRTAPIQHGDVCPTISATGTVEPEDLIDVGSQVSGKILSFGPDPDNPQKTVDFNSVVHKDMLLATIDRTYYQAQADQAKAAMQKAEADLKQLEAKCEQTKQEWKRAESLRPLSAIADTDYDTAVANYRVAEANVAVGKASVQQAKAALSMAQTNLDYTVIKSPVEGVVIARRVNAGQTMAAGLNTPSMFLIAKDLRRMQVWASVNEADLGQIHPDMPVRFTVDAFPSETFRGKVAQIRMNATMTQNVVTYTVVISTDNSNLKLLPYLTANVQFEVDQRSDVLLTPNAALRWQPQASQIAPQVEATGAPAAKPAGNPEERGRLWLIDGNFVRPLDVVVGVTDGSVTEISGNGAKEGLQVVVGTASKEEVAEDKEKTTNPFLPQMPKGRKPPPPPG